MGYYTPRFPLRIRRLLRCGSLFHLSHEHHLGLDVCFDAYIHDMVYPDELTEKTHCWLCPLLGNLVSLRST
jgi:hypothetical protein